MLRSWPSTTKQLGAWRRWCASTRRSQPRCLGRKLLRYDVNHSSTFPVTDYEMWMAIQERVYHADIQSVYELKQQLIFVWCSLDQDIIDIAVDKWC